MKRVILSALLIFFASLLTGCMEDYPYQDKDEEMFLRLDENKESLKILQITDLHLTYGFDGKDRKTFKLINKLVDKENPDLVVASGDITMSPAAPRLYKKFIKEMDKLGVPWTFVFGNHDNDFNRYSRILNIVKNSNAKNLLFQVGMDLSDEAPNYEPGGYGNFKIQVEFLNNPFYNLYFMDSKNERDNYEGDSEFEYGYLSYNQVNWYKDQVASDTVNSLVFMHIPLWEYKENKEFANEPVCAQGVNTGLFQAIIDAGKTLGVFVGHDHTNNFVYEKDGVKLCYGVCTGYNAYGQNDKGGRIVEISTASKAINTYIVTASEVLS